MLWSLIFVVGSSLANGFEQKVKSSTSKLIAAKFLNPKEMMMVTGSATIKELSFRERGGWSTFYDVLGNLGNDDLDTFIFAAIAKSANGDQIIACLADYVSGSFNQQHLEVSCRIESINAQFSRDRLLTYAQQILDENSSQWSGSACRGRSYEWQNRSCLENSLYL